MKGAFALLPGVPGPEYIMQQRTAAHHSLIGGRALVCIEIAGHKQRIGPDRLLDPFPLKACRPIDGGWLIIKMGIYKGERPPGYPMKKIHPGHGAREDAAPAFAPREIGRIAQPECLTLPDLEGGSFDQDGRHLGGGDAIATARHAEKFVLL